MADVYTTPSIALGTSSMGIQHKQAAGQQFTGVFPTGVQTVANGTCKYTTPVTPAGQGGLFDFVAGEPHIVWLYANLGGSVAYVVTIENLDPTTTPADAVIAGESVQVAAATGQYLALGPYRLLSRQALKLVTSGAAAAMVARAVAITEKGYRG